MKRTPTGGIIGKLTHIFGWLDRMDIPRQAASTCYFICLAVFPALVLILSLLHFTSLEAESLLSMLDGVLPSALMPYARRLILNTYQNTSGAMVSFSALLALWSASRGIHGLMIGLNHIYDVGESRGFVYTRLVSVGYTFAFIIVLLLTLVLHVFGTTIAGLLPASGHPFLRFLSSIIDTRFFLLLFLQTALFTAMYMVLPNKNNAFSDSLPGALLAAICWLVISDAFSIYVEYFPYYANIYGSVYAVALSMLWLYLCISVVFYGGVLNHYLMDRPASPEKGGTGK